MVGITVVGFVKMMKMNFGMSEIFRMFLSSQHGILNTKKFILK